MYDNAQYVNLNNCGLGGGTIGSVHRQVYSAAGRSQGVWGGGERILHIIIMVSYIGPSVKLDV